MFAKTFARVLACSAIGLLSVSLADAAITISISSPTNGQRVSPGQPITVTATVSGAVVGINTITFTGERAGTLATYNFGPAPPTNNATRSATYNVPMDVADDEELTITVSASGYADDPVSSSVNVIGPEPGPTIPDYVDLFSIDDTSTAAYAAGIDTVFFSGNPLGEIFSLDPTTLSTTEFQSSSVIDGRFGFDVTDDGTRFAGGYVGSPETVYLGDIDGSPASWESMPNSAIPHSMKFLDNDRLAIGLSSSALGTAAGIYTFSNDSVAPIAGTETWTHSETRVAVSGDREVLAVGRADTSAVLTEVRAYDAATLAPIANYVLAAPATGRGFSLNRYGNLLAAGDRVYNLATGESIAQVTGRNNPSFTNSGYVVRYGPIVGPSYTTIELSTASGQTIATEPFWFGNHPATYLGARLIPIGTLDGSDPHTRVLVCDGIGDGMIVDFSALVAASSASGWTLYE